MNAKEKESMKTLDSMLDLLGLVAELESSSTEKAIVLNLKSEDPGRIIGRNGQTIDAMQLLMNKMLRRSEDRYPPIILDVEGYKQAKKERRNSNRRRVKSDDENVEKAPKVEKAETEAPKAEKKADKETSERQPRKRQQRPRNNNNAAKGRGEQPQSRLSEEREEAITKQAVEASKEVKRWGETVTLPPMSSAERRIVHLALEHDPEVETESASTSQNGKKRVIVRSC